MSYLSEHFPRFDCDEFGNVLKDSKPAKIFKSNKYLQVLLFDDNGKRKVCGVHSVVAMKYLNYYDGCIVHHIDENTHNNRLSNLEIMTKSKHCSLHITENGRCKTMNLGKTPWNKGKKYKFCGNRYVDMNGNKK